MIRTTNYLFSAYYGLVAHTPCIFSYFISPSLKINRKDHLLPVKERGFKGSINMDVPQTLYKQWHTF